MKPSAPLVRFSKAPGERGLFTLSELKTTELESLVARSCEFRRQGPPGYSGPEDYRARRSQSRAASHLGANLGLRAARHQLHWQVFQTVHHNGAEPPRFAI